VGFSVSGLPHRRWPPARQAWIRERLKGGQNPPKLPPDDGSEPAGQILHDGSYTGMIKVRKRRLEMSVAYDSTEPTKLLVAPAFDGRGRGGSLLSSWSVGLFGSPELTIDGNRFSGTVRRKNLRADSAGWGWYSHYTWKVSGTIVSPEQINVKISGKVRYTKGKRGRTIARCTTKPAKGTLRPG
jgi:hypothetical protein